MITTRINRAIHHRLRFCVSSLLGEGLRYKHMIVHWHNLFARVNRLRRSKDSVETILGELPSKIIPINICNEHYYQNSLYGIAGVLRSYASYNAKICACIEHGLFLGSYVNNAEVINSGLPGVITFSEVRKAHIKEKSQICVYPIGPYIQYANPYLAKKRASLLKEKLGKTLLVFPSHSIVGTGVFYDFDQFESVINRIVDRNKFDSVIVNLYYTDFCSELADRYRSRGYHVTCAGHNSDPLFLSRLRSLIEIADYSISNSCGTHVGYCIALGTPHTIIQQRIELIPDSALEARNQNSSVGADEEKNEICLAFSRFGSITGEQREVCRKYWGLDIMLSPSEMKAMLSALEAEMV
ncbi:hypothetical protein [Enorma massiliensis]|uniref:hypothetical protein n=1 Tax=Enorma massiliensis TaxID=1472761 RepID=UPI003A8CB173